MKKKSPMAQTTCLASFGPVFVVSAQSITNLVIRTYIHSRTFVSIKKKQRKMKKKLTYGPNDVRRVVWARFHCPKMVRTQFAPKGNGTKRLEAEGLLMGGSTWFTQRGSSWCMPSDNLVKPRPIRNFLLDSLHSPSLCLTFSKTVAHIAATIVHPSNRADTLMFSPCGPSSVSAC